MEKDESDDKVPDLEDPPLEDVEPITTGILNPNSYIGTYPPKKLPQNRTYVDPSYERFGPTVWTLPRYSQAMEKEKDEYESDHESDSLARPWRKLLAAAEEVKRDLELHDPPNVHLKLIENVVNVAKAVLDFA